MKYPSADRKKRVEEVLEQMQIMHRKDHFLNNSLGGQQQMVAVARAVVAKSNLFQDEPTGNLDSTNGQEVMTLLSDLNAKGTTVVMVTHSATDSEYAHRVINLFDGQVVSENINSKENSLV